jgi:hypothetical protein
MAQLDPTTRKAAMAASSWVRSLQDRLRCAGVGHAVQQLPPEQLALLDARLPGWNWRWQDHLEACSTLAQACACFRVMAPAGECRRERLHANRRRHTACGVQRQVLASATAWVAKQHNLARDGRLSSYCVRSLLWCRSGLQRQQPQQRPAVLSAMTLAPACAHLPPEAQEAGHLASSCMLSVGQSMWQRGHADQRQGFWPFVPRRCGHVPARQLHAKVAHDRRVR